MSGHNGANNGSQNKTLGSWQRISLDAAGAWFTQTLLFNGGKSLFMRPVGIGGNPSIRQGSFGLETFVDSFLLLSGSC